MIQLKNTAPSAAPKKEASQGNPKSRSRLPAEMKQSPSWIRYKERALAKCRSRKDEEKMESLLEAEYKLAQKFDQSQRDWDSYPLPLLPSEKLANSTLQLNNKKPDYTSPSELMAHLTQPFREQKAKPSQAQQPTHFEAPQSQNQRGGQRANGANNSAQAARKPVAWPTQNGSNPRNGSNKPFIDPNGMFRKSDSRP